MRLKMAKVYILVAVMKACLGINLLINPDIDGGYTSSGLIKYTEQRSILQCAVECVLDPSCKMMAHAASGLRCFSYNTAITPDTTLVTTFYANFYVVTVCPRYDYVYNESIGVCIKVSSHYKNYTNAKQACEDDGAHMFLVTSAARYTFLVDIYEDSRFWLGGTKSPNNLSEWNWGNGDIITQENGGSFWLPGKPTSVDGADCMFMKFSIFYDIYGLYNTGCFNNKRYLCEIEPQL